MQISDYPDLYLQCSIDDRFLSIFYVDTGQYKEERCGYRKRTAPKKLVVKLPLVEECLQFIVRKTATFDYVLHELSHFFPLHFFNLAIFAIFVVAAVYYATFVSYISIFPN